MNWWTSRSSHPAAGFVGLLILYYGLPASGQRPFVLAIAVVATLAGVGLLAWAIIGQVRKQIQGLPGSDVGSLLLLLGMVVFVFAFGFYALSIAAPQQIAGLETRTDSLYFTLSTLTTVGFGDIHAVGQLARGLVIVQLVFDVIFVAALGSTLARQMRARAEARMTSRSSGSRPTEDPSPDISQRPEATP